MKPFLMLLFSLFFSLPPTSLHSVCIIVIAPAIIENTDLCSLIKGDHGKNLLFGAYLHLFLILTFLPHCFQIP